MTSSCYGQLAAFCFFGFLQCGEVLVPNSSTFDPDTHLSLDDVSFGTSTSRCFFLLTIKASITDKFRQGGKVALGNTGTDLCPVDARFSFFIII